MNIPGIVGLALAWFLIIWGMGFGNLGSFIDPPSIRIVIGGTIAALFLAYPLSTMKQLPSILKQAFFNTGANAPEIIKLLVGFADKARREGILSLEDSAQNSCPGAFSTWSMPWRSTSSTKCQGL